MQVQSLGILDVGRSLPSLSWNRKCAKYCHWNLWPTSAQRSKLPGPSNVVPFLTEKNCRDMSWQEDMSKQQNSGRPAFCRGNNKTLSWDSRPAWSSFFANTSASKRWNNSCATETNNFKAIVSLELAHFNTRLCFVINGSVSVILKRKLLRTDFSKHTSNRHSYSLSVQSHKWALHIQPTVCHCSLACNLVEAKQTVQFMSTEQHLNQFTKRLSSLWCCTQKPVLDRWNLESVLNTQYSVVRAFEAPAQQWATCRKKIDPNHGICSQIISRDTRDEYRKGRGKAWWNRLNLCQSIAGFYQLWQIQPSTRIRYG